MPIIRAIIQFVAVFIIFAIVAGGGQGLFLGEEMVAMEQTFRAEGVASNMLYASWVLGTFAIVALYNSLIKSTSIGDGIHYGVFIGMIYVGTLMGQFAFYEQPTKVLVVSVISMMLACVLSGAFLAWNHGAVAADDETSIQPD